MANLSVYLNFQHQTEEAFTFYQKVFNGRIIGEPKRFGDFPIPALTEDDKNLIAHMELEILGKHILKGTDALASLGFSVKMGNNIYITIQTDSREETTQYFNALSEEGVVTQPLEDMYWGAYYGSCTDKYGVQWVITNG